MKKLLSRLMLACTLTASVAAFTQDQMSQDSMKKDDSKQDTMKNDQMKKDKKSKKTAKKDSMKKDDMQEDSMKDDNKKNEMKQDEMKKTNRGPVLRRGLPSPRFTLFNLDHSVALRCASYSFESMSASASHSSAICPADAVWRYSRKHRVHGTYPCWMASFAVRVRSVSLLWITPHPGVWKSLASVVTTTFISGGIPCPGCASSDFKSGVTVTEFATRSPPANKAIAASGTIQVDHVGQGLLLTRALCASLFSRPPSISRGYLDHPLVPIQLDHIACPLHTEAHRLHVWKCASIAERSVASTSPSR